MELFWLVAHNDNLIMGVQKQPSRPVVVVVLCHSIYITYSVDSVFIKGKGGKVGMMPSSGQGRGKHRSREGE